MTSDKSTAQHHRLNFLDGLRGVAIFAVILFHSYARWPNLVPFGNRFTEVPLFSYGWLGVELFFLISGFVIFMTLEKSQNFGDFISRRWLRLFPAMLICSTLVFASAALFPERPAGMPVARDMLPGLTFIEPAWWAFLLGSPQGVIEGAFWSLFVEVKFYFIAGCLFFFIGGRKMISALIGLFVIAAAIGKLQHLFPAANLHWPNVLMQMSSAGQFGWFAAGALYYRYFHERKSGLLSAAILVALASATVTGGLRWEQTLATLTVVLIFTAAVTASFIQSMLNRRWLIFLGFISYPLYLLHENMMVAMIVKMGHATPWMPSILMPLLPIVAVIAVGSCIALYIEPWVRERLRPVYRKLRFLMGIAAPAA
jgi:peptidoglycan/LPS O-acetylase OafA/YrhL